MMRTIDVNEAIDNNPFGRFQWSVVALCALLLIVDGYDVFVAGTVLPTLIAEWGLSKPQAGALQAWALFGMMFGALIFGPLAAGLLSFAYLFVVSTGNVGLTIVLAILIFGVLYQMWNATFASYFQELFPTRTRVTGFAVSQNIALFLTGFLPSIFTAIAPPGSSSVPLIIGTATLVLSLVSAAAAWRSRETAKLRLDALDGKDATGTPAADGVAETVPGATSDARTSPA